MKKTKFVALFVIIALMMSISAFATSSPPTIPTNEVDEIGTAFDWHFYDPATGLSWNPFSSSTAKSNFIDCYYSAITYYNLGNNDAAFQCLGRALHYIQDLGEPHVLQV